MFGNTRKGTEFGKMVPPHPHLHQKPITSSQRSRDRITAAPMSNSVGSFLEDGVFAPMTLLHISAFLLVNHDVNARQYPLGRSAPQSLTMITTSSLPFCAAHSAML